MPRSSAVVQAETRKRILAIASEEFTTRPVSAVSLDSIAAQAGYTKGAVYSNFASKKDLLFAVIEDRYEQFGSDYYDITTGAADEALGAEIGERADKTSANDLGFFRLLAAVWAEAVYDADFAARFLEIRLRHRKRVAASIEQRADDFDIALPVDAEELATGILAMSMATFLESTIDPSVSPAQVHKVVIDLILAGVLATAEPQSDGSDA